MSSLLTPQILLELLLGGISLGGIYALMALALSLALATTHILNVAHGSFMVLGAAASTLLIKYLGLSPVPSLVILVAGFALVGWVFELVCVRPLQGRAPDRILIGSILITFGFALAFEAGLGFYWAKLVDPQPTFSLTLTMPRLTLWGVSLSGTRLVILAFVCLAVLVFHLFLTKTPVGKMARAIAQDYEGALILGVNPRLVSVTIFTVGLLATALSGLFFILATPLGPHDGLRLTLVAMTVIVIGGVGSLPGALLGGIVLGITDVFTAFVFGAVWSPVTYVLVFFVVLLVRPQGLVGIRQG
ncbi:MAG: branched-chain amino acid ABC transporter permease [Armatimonadetes bacterium]|nr:branched-chain amino acid ABC transporter permease [Armatimonadota bacterium]